MMVPTAMIQMNEPHAALSQPAGEQAIGSKRAVPGLPSHTPF